jgi:hypothetical protein
MRILMFISTVLVVSVADSRYLWYTSIAFGLFGVICALFVKEMDSKLTDHIQVDLEKVKQLRRRGATSEKELEAQRSEQAVQ